MTPREHREIAEQFASFSKVMLGISIAALVSLPFWIAALVSLPFWIAGACLIYIAGACLIYIAGSCLIYKVWK